MPAGQPGNLVGRSQTMMSGYKNQPDKTREGYWTDPDAGPGDDGVWQRMGDIGRVDAEGFVELVGRAKDMIISGGFNIFPSDLEAELEKDARVAEAAVIGVPSKQWGETPLGFVRLENGVAEGEVADILGTVNGNVGKTQRLSALYAIDEMPRSHIGKLLKTELRERAEELTAIRPDAARRIHYCARPAGTWGRGLDRRATRFYPRGGYGSGRAGYPALGNIMAVFAQMPAVVTHRADFVMCWRKTRNRAGYGPYRGERGEWVRHRRAACFE